MKRNLCPGSGLTTYDCELRFDVREGTKGARFTIVETWAKCPRCQRVLKPTPAGLVLRDHSQRGYNTASLDNTREILFDNASRRYVVLSDYIFSHHAVWDIAEDTWYDGAGHADAIEYAGVPTWRTRALAQRVADMLNEPPT